MRPERRAFTLIELLAVLVIIAILSALILGVAVYAKRAALTKRASAQVEQMHFIIQEYQIKNGRLPANLENLQSTMPEGFTYSNNVPLDPWGTPFQYTVSGETYRLFSMGPDMATGMTTNSVDDIETGR